MDSLERSRVQGDAFRVGVILGIIGGFLSGVLITLISITP